MKKVDVNDEFICLNSFVSHVGCFYLGHRYKIQKVESGSVTILCEGGCGHKYALNQIINLSFRLATPVRLQPWL